MKIIISPAKKMNRNTDEPAVITQPVFLEEAVLLWEKLREMTYEELKHLWGCSDKLAEENYRKLQDFRPDRGSLTPALISYEGIQYQYMAPQVFTRTQWEYVNRHLRILSGMYGLLEPADGVVPYRLEMQARLSGNHGKDLYAFWKDRICCRLTEGEDWILNLASKEYSRVVEPYMPGSIPFITCVFAELSDGKPKIKGTQAKMARGEMVRWMAENGITKAEQLRAFCSLGYVYDETYSAPDTLVFLKKKEKAKNPV